MSTLELIRQRLAVLQPAQLEVIDDSHHHIGHAGAKDGGGHYQVVIVSAAFVGKSTLARHRMVYAAVADLMPRQIHALAIDARTP